MKRIWLLGMGVILAGLLTSNSHAATAVDEYQAGLAAYKAGNWQQAVIELNQAVQLDPTQWQGYQLLGYAYSQEGHLSAALEACRQSLTVHPDNPILKNYVDNTLQPRVTSAAVENMPPAPSAQNVAEPLHNSIYVNLGGDYLDEGTGDDLGLGYGFAVSNNFSIVVDLRLFYFFFEYGDDVFNISAMANAKFDFMDSHNPEVLYGIAGLGLAEYIEADSYYSYNETDLAYRLGLGLDIHLNPGFCLFLENDLEGTIGSDFNSRFGFFDIGLKMD